MIGKASKIKTKFVRAHYYYPTPGNYKERVWVELDQTINTALEELGDVQVVQIQYTAQDTVIEKDCDANETALIIYRINE